MNNIEQSVKPNDKPAAVNKLKKQLTTLKKQLDQELAYVENHTDYDLLYDEFMIYNTAQVRIKYLLEVEMEF